MPHELRCSDVSEMLGEPLAGSAPTDDRWLFVEHPGAWGPKAPGDVLPPTPGIRQQLIRGVGRTEASGQGRRAFLVDLREGASVPLATARLPATGLDLEAVEWTPYDAPLWLVCTNGRRDVCCAELGRPVAAALAQRWPDDVWETTHLGGHRFAPTLLALPSGYVLGRVTPARVVAACEEVAAGRLPLDLVRGRAGQAPQDQAVEVFARREHGLTALGDRWADVPVRVEAVLGEPRRTSCSDAVGKPVTSWVVQTT